METRSLQALMPSVGWKDRGIGLQTRENIVPFRSWQDGNTGARDGDKRANYLGWKDRLMAMQYEIEIRQSVPSTYSKTESVNEYMTSCEEDLTSSASSASFQSYRQSSLNSLPQDDASSMLHVSSNPNPFQNPHVLVNMSQVRIRSVEHSQSSIQSVSTSEVSVQQIVPASTSAQVRPLPRPPVECNSKKIQVETSEDHCGILSCCNRRKYYKVGNVRADRNNMAWMLRKKTLLSFSTMSMLLALLSCGTILVLRFWEILFGGRAYNVCVVRDSRILTAGELQNRNATDCQSQIQKVLESLTVTGREEAPEGKACSVHVRRDGWFFIYSSVRVTKCTLPTKQWKHKIVLVARNQTTTNQTLTMAVRTCCVDCPVYDETSFTGAIYRLEKGDQLTVFSDLPNMPSNQTCIDAIHVG